MSFAKRFVVIPISLFFVIILFISASLKTALAFLVGSFACWLGELLFTGMLVQKIRSKRAHGFLPLFVVAEWIKLATYAITLLIGVTLFHLKLVPALMGFIINLILFWIVSFKVLGDG